MTDLFPALSLTQRAHRDSKHRQHYERQAMYPRDPVTGKRIKRLSPRMLAPTNAPANGQPAAIPPDYATSMRICIEHPGKYPNGYLYLFQLKGQRRWRWFTKDGHPTPETFDSVFEAIVRRARSGWLDASW